MFDNWSVAPQYRPDDTVGELVKAVPCSYASVGERPEERLKEWGTQMDTHLKKLIGNTKDALVAVERPSFIQGWELHRRGYKLTDAWRVMEGARVIKSDNEINLIKAGMAAIIHAVKTLRDNITPGITENELWSILHQMNIAYDGEYIETRLMSSGQKTNPWWQESDQKPIKAGEIVGLDTDVVGPFQYYIDFSRTFVCPNLDGGFKPTDEQRRLYRASFDQIQQNVAALQPGISFKEFAQKCWPIPQEFFAQRYFVNTHGVGMSGCGEYPFIQYAPVFDQFGYDGVLLPGMTVCVESYIGVVGGKEGVKLEQQVLIKDKGVEVLSQDMPFEDCLL